MYNRYLFFKKLYPDYIILIIKGDKLKSIGIDKEILNYIGYEDIKDINKESINYIIINGLEIEEIKENKVNNYDTYFLRVELTKMVMNINKGMGF